MNRSEEMFSLVDDYRQSGLTQKAFCSQAGIGLAKLNYWVSRSKEVSEPQGFVALAGMKTGKEVTLEYPSGVKLRVDTSDLLLISRLVNL